MILRVQNIYVGDQHIYSALFIYKILDYFLYDYYRWIYLL